jgi:hypothetical protein
MLDLDVFDVLGPFLLLLDGVVGGLCRCYRWCLRGGGRHGRVVGGYGDPNLGFGRRGRPDGGFGMCCGAVLGRCVIVLEGDIVLVGGEEVEFGSGVGSNILVVGVDALRMSRVEDRIVVVHMSRSAVVHAAVVIPWVVPVSLPEMAPRGNDCRLMD